MQNSAFLESSECKIPTLIMKSVFQAKTHAHNLVSNMKWPLYHISFFIFVGIYICRCFINKWVSEQPRLGKKFGKFDKFSKAKCQKNERFYAIQTQPSFSNQLTYEFSNDVLSSLLIICKARTPNTSNKQVAIFTIGMRRSCFVISSMFFCHPSSASYTKILSCELKAAY